MVDIRDVLTAAWEDSCDGITVSRFADEFRFKTSLEFLPSSFGFSSCMDLFQHLAEQGKVQLYFEDGKVWISTRPPPEPVVNYVTLLHLDLDLPWDLEVDPQLPHGAVLTETIADWPIKLAGQEFQFIEVTQVDSVARFWFSPAPEERQKLMVELQRYYETGEGRSWGFSDTRYCQPGTFLAARYSSQAFHRVTVLDTFPAYDRVRVLFIDYGTIQAVPVRNLRLLHRKFLRPVRQAVPARLWRVPDLPSCQVTLLTVLLEDVYLEPGDLDARVMADSGCGEEEEGLVSVLLVDWLGGNINLNREVMIRNNAGWDVPAVVLSSESAS